MRGFQTNPYWTVPQSISGEEYLPILRRDPHALRRRLQDLRELERRHRARSRHDRLELDPSQGLPLPHPPGARRRQCAGLHLLPVHQQVRDLHARHGQPLAVHRGQPQLQPWLHPPAEPARLRREGVQRPQRLQQGARAPGDRCRPAGALHLPRADHALRDVPHGDGRCGGRADLPRRRLRPRPPRRAGDGEASECRGAATPVALCVARQDAPLEWRAPSSQRFLARSFFQYSRRFRISRSKPRSTGW